MPESFRSIEKVPLLRSASKIAAICEEGSFSMSYMSSVTDTAIKTGPRFNAA